MIIFFKILNVKQIFFFPFSLFLCCVSVAAQLPFNKHGDSIIIAVEPSYDSVHKFHRFLFGEGYRKVWAAPVKLKVFNLSSEKGGLTILQAGGGLQTKSLRLKDNTGKEYVLRSIQKYPERGLPEKLRKTVARDILQDQVITSHPYAALTVPPFAEALNIPHSNPQVVFLPDDPLLGKFRKDFSNTVLLFEEREPVDTFDTDNTEKVQRKVENDNKYEINQQLLLRARLLDIFLGDWDRHEDQWRWKVLNKENGTIEYIPIPRDRDKVYYSTTGLFPWILSHQWLKANLQRFDESLRDIEEYNYNNRYFDRYFLNQLSEATWREEIDFVKHKLTDSLIIAAIKLLPEPVYQLTGKHLTQILIKRRKFIEAESLKYYRFLSTYVDIPASDKNEKITVKYNGDDRVSVAVNKLEEDGTLGKNIYQRNFNSFDTKEIRLYGLGGKDVFEVNGSGKTNIRVRMVGGGERDSFYVDPNNNNRSRLYVYDRSDKNNSFPDKSLAKLRASIDSNVNVFNRKAFVYDQNRILGSVFFNPDQGLLLRGGFLRERQGFRKEPYASRQLFYANYATTWKSFMFTYLGNFKEVFGKTDLSVSLISRGPYNIDNFFGVGNETVFLNRKEDDAIKFYQNHFDYINGDVRLSNKFFNSLKISGGLAAEFYASSLADNTNKYLINYFRTHPSEPVFTNQFFAGLVGNVELDTRSDMLMPTKGIYWNTEVRRMEQLNGMKKSYGKIFSEFSFYIPLKDSTIILANRVAGGTISGSPAFFQQFKLGGPANLRGYNINRFTGKSMVYHNFELRMKLFDFTSYIVPGTIGLIGFNDIGRVWTPGEKSSKWHTGYGGGFYIIPADLILIQALLARSNEQLQPYFSVGVRF